MLNRLTERVYYMDFVQHGDRPVLGLVVGDRASLVIDGGNSEAHAKEFLHYVSELDIPPVKYLALTHWHWDHVFGMKTMNLINIVNSKTNKMLDWMRTLSWTNKAIDERIMDGEEIEFCRENIMIEHPDNDRHIEIANADIIYDDEITIDLGGVSVYIKNVTCDHSFDSNIIYIPDEKVAFLGDAIYQNMYAERWNYTKKKLYPLLEWLSNLDCDYYIPAHHKLYNKKAFQRFCMYQGELGNIAGSDTMIDSALVTFRELFNREPNEFEMEDLQAHINGNILEQ